MFSFLLKGGFLILPILLCSIISVTIIVAIPTLVAFHYFEGRVDNIAAELKETATEIPEI